MATNAIALNGTNQGGKIDNFSGLDSLTNFTIEVWVKNSASSAAYDPILKLETSTPTTFFGSSTENGVGNEGCNWSTEYDGDPDADGYVSDSVFPQGTWTHFAAVHNASTKKTYIFTNGVEHNGYNLLKSYS